MARMTGMDGVAPARAATLAARLQQASGALIALIEPIDVDRWSGVPGPGVWSIGKDAAHVAEATVRHQWIVRRTIRDRVSSRPPPIERREMTTELSPAEAVALLRKRTADAERLILGLTDEQLSLPTRPPRARALLLGETIDRVLIGHIHTHRDEIEAKLRGGRW